MAGPAKRQERVRTVLQAGAIVALIFVCYVPSLQGGFLWDDDANVSENQTLHSLEGLYLIWASPFANQQFYPLTHTSFWVEYRLWELWPTGYRITNLLLHGLVAALFWTALRRLSVPGAWVAAAIFAVHPVHAETVAWITERKNLLSAVFYFAALLTYLRFAGLDGRDPLEPHKRRLAYLLSLVLFIFMLLSKTAFLTLPATLLVIVWWKRGRLGRGDLASTMPMLGMAAAFGLITSWLERVHVLTLGADWDLSLLERLIVAGRVVWFYAWKLVLPVDLNFIYPRWNVESAAFWQYLFPLTAIAVPVLLWRYRETIGRGPLAGIVIFGLTLAPVLGIVSFYFQLYSFVQDHFQYVASVGLIALLVALAAVGLRRVDARAPAVVAMVVLLVLAGATWQRSKVFVDKESLWTSTLERNPRAWIAANSLGIVYESQGRYAEALELFEHALGGRESQRHKPRFNMARTLVRLGRLAEAREQYELGLELDPDRADVHHDLALLLERLGDLDAAEAHYRAALLIDPDLAGAHNNLAIVLYNKKRYGEAWQEVRYYRQLGGVPHPDFIRALTEASRIADPNR